MDNSEWHTYLNQLVISDAIRPSNWGPPCWNFLDYLCFSYPIAPNAEEQQNMANYFNALKNVLPCLTCKTDFKQMLDEDPIDRHLHSREALTLWLLDKHNRVNSKLGKKQLSINDYVNHFKKRHQPRLHEPTPNKMQMMAAQASQKKKEEEPCCSPSSYKALIWILLGVAGLLGIAYVMSKSKK